MVPSGTRGGAPKREIGLQSATAASWGTYDGVIIAKRRGERLLRAEHRDSISNTLQRERNPDAQAGPKRSAPVPSDSARRLPLPSSGTGLVAGRRGPSSLSRNESFWSINPRHLQRSTRHVDEHVRGRLVHRPDTDQRRRPKSPPLSASVWDKRTTLDRSESTQGRTLGVPSPLSGKLGADQHRRRTSAATGAA